MNRFALLLIGLTLIPNLTGAQPIALPDAGSAGVGAFFHRTDRDFDLSSGDQLRGAWSRGGFIVHATLAHRVVLMATGSYEPPNEDSRFPGRIYQALGVGAGATAYPFVMGPYRIGASLRWYRHVWQDQSLARSDKVVDGVTVAIQAERGFRTRSLNALVWVAPAYLRDRWFEYPGLFLGSEHTTSGNIGAIAGASVVLWGHVTPYVQFGVVERLQTQAGVSYIY